MKPSRLSRTSPLSIAMVAVWGPVCAASAQEYRADIGNCRASVEQWIRHEAAGGRKLLARLGEYGAFQEMIVRWDSGTIQQVTIGPAIAPDGKPAICVVARRHVGTQLSASADKLRMARQARNQRGIAHFIADECRPLRP